MKIVSSFLPPASNPAPFKTGQGDNQASARQPATQAVERAKAPVVVGELETALEQAQARRDIIDLRALQDEPLPLNSLRALSSYQRVAAEPVAAATGLAGLDIIV